ncbi:glycosyltransferase family 4 protein [Microbacterium halotolerans]|uniref:glycosyltransferase family 4 protein n=1 Tax=Microbacterium halotolerans TaxID=246613 RepID=UPI000E6AAA04|nr:glycosyltransferase family 4 protein [Microbacterium halotolerans]
MNGTRAALAPETAGDSEKTPTGGAHHADSLGAVDFVVPAWVEDTARISGGNVYDLAVHDALEAQGWNAYLHRVDVGDAAMSSALRDMRDGTVVLVDGLLASRAAHALARETTRLRVVVLAHMVESSAAVASKTVIDGERRALRAARGVVATSRWTRDALVSLGFVSVDRVVIARPAVAGAVSPAEPGPRGERLLCVGPLAPHKGQDILVRALAGIEVEQRWKCTFVGSSDIDPAFSDALRDQVDASSLRDRIRFVGVLTGRRMTEQFTATDLLVAPSRDEPFGMAAAEASAHGIPVLAARTGGLPEAIAANAGRMFVPPDDPHALRRALQRWWSDDSTRAAVARDAMRTRSTTRSWDDTALDVAAALTAAAERSDSP